MNYRANDRPAHSEGRLSNQEGPASKVSVIIPAYNEGESVGAVVDEVGWVLGAAGIDHEIIVVDDGSTDNTVDFLESRDVILVRHPENRGYGAALKTGIRHVQGDIIVTIDADGTYPTSPIPELVRLAHLYDMVVGARVGKEVEIPLFRRPAKSILTRLAGYLAGSRIPDLNSGLRAFKKETVMPFFRLLPSGYSFTMTITLALLTNDYTVKYLPIDYYRRKGKSKIRPIRDTANFIQLIFRTVMYFAPLKVFMPISIFLFLGGFFILLYSYLVLGKVMDITVIVTMLAALQIAVIGLLADLIDKRGLL